MNRDTARAEKTKVNPDNQVAGDFHFLDYFLTLYSGHK